MTTKIPCDNCGVMILPTTAEKNAGLCMPCANPPTEEEIKAKEFSKNPRILEHNYINLDYYTHKAIEKNPKAFAVVRILERYLGNEITRWEFNKEYPQLLLAYEEQREDSIWDLVEILIPPENPYEKNCIRLLKEEYEDKAKHLEKLMKKGEIVGSDQESLIERLNENLGRIREGSDLSERKQKRLCKQVLELLHPDIFNEETGIWIEEKLLTEKEKYVFYTKSGKSKFGADKCLYKVNLESHSILLSALSGNFHAVNYKKILSTLKALNHSIGAQWVSLSEPDGIAIKSCLMSIYYPYEDEEHISMLDVDWTEMQGGISYMMLLSNDKSWILLFTNSFKEFRIDLHASKQFIEKFDDLFSSKEQELTSNST